MSIAAAQGGLRRSILLRVLLAMPLLYVLLERLQIRWEYAFASDQALDYYVVNGLLFGVPIAVWLLAFVLLVVGTANRVLWAVVCVGGFATTAYGLLFVFDGELRLNAAVAFGLYAALLGLWQLLSRREPGRPPKSEPQA